MSDIVFAKVVSWFQKNSKIPLSSMEKSLLLEKFEHLGLEIELLQLAEDEDIRELCPEKLSLTRWQVREALKSVRG